MPGVLSGGSAFVDAQPASSCNACDFGFDNPQYSDRVLHVLQETDGDSAEAQGAGKQATVLRSMHINSLTLAANSEVLRQKMEERSDDGNTKDLRLEVKAGEEVMLEHLIRFCYSKQVTLTEEKSLLRLIQLADRLMMADCVDICAAALTPEDAPLSLQSAYRYLRLPSGLQSNQSFAQLVQQATSRVRAEFDDLDAVWTNESLQAAFLKLPLPALLTVLTSPELKSITENTVFIAISHWMHRAAKKPKAAACMDATAHQLANCIRFPMLTNDFLHFVVSQLELYNDAKCVSITRDGMQLHLEQGFSNIVSPQLVLQPGLGSLAIIKPHKLYMYGRDQAAWLPKEYGSGSLFRAAARYKGAPIKLQQQLAHGSGTDNAMYLSRRMGVGSSVSIMHWEVPITKLAAMKRKGRNGTLRIPGEYYLCGFYWYLIMQYNSSGTSLGCFLHWTAKLNSATEVSPPEAFVLASISLSLKNEKWGPDFAQVASMKCDQNWGGGLGMGWGNPFKIALSPGEHEADLVRHLDSAGFVTEGFLDVQFTVSVRLDQ